MYPFTYHRPSSVSRAAEILANSEDGKFLAGGQTLIPTLKQRLAMPGDLVDLGAIEALHFIKSDGKTTTIGAGISHADVAASEEVQRHLPALAHLAEGIGDPAVRHRGTLGGSLANNDPAADYPAAVLALDARLQTSKRRIDAGSFFTGLFSTLLEEDEILTHITFPHPDKAAYVKFPNPASRYAMVGVFVARTDKGVRVAVTGAGQDGVFRVPQMEEALANEWSPEALNPVSVSGEELISDLHGAADYRAHLVTVMARRAVEAANAFPAAPHA